MSSSNILHNGAKITGQTSGTGFVQITKQDLVGSGVKNGSDATVTVMPTDQDGLRHEWNNFSCYSNHRNFSGR